MNQVESTTKDNQMGVPVLMRPPFQHRISFFQPRGIPAALPRAKSSTGDKLLAAELRGI